MADGIQRDIADEIARLQAAKEEASGRQQELIAAAQVERPQANIQEAFGRALAAAIPVAIAGAVGGKAGLAGGARGASRFLAEEKARDEAAFNRGLKRDAALAAIQGQQVRGLDKQIQGLREKQLDFRGQAERDERQAASKLDLEKALLPNRLAVAQAGASRTNVNTKLQPIEKGVFDALADTKAASALIDDTLKRLDKFKGQGAFSFQGLSLLSGTDEGKLKAALDDVTTQIASASLKGVISDADFARMRKIVVGDITAGPEDIAELLTGVKRRLNVQLQARQEALRDVAEDSTTLQAPTAPVSISERILLEKQRRQRK